MTDDGPMTDAESALTAAWRLQRSGNFVAAFDLAQEALLRNPDSLALQHVSILALASCGSTEAALAAFQATALADTAHEDYLALEARLLKDMAFLDTDVDGGALLIRAAEAYERIAERTGGSFTAQNAAMLWMLSGGEERATRLARSVLATLGRNTVPADHQAAYFHWATLAEAAVVLKDRAVLERAVGEANVLCRINLWARTRTFAQLRRLQPLRPDCADLIERWYRPAIGLVLDDEPRSTGVLGEPTAGGEMPALAFASGLTREAEWQSLAGQGVQLHVIVANAPVERPKGWSEPLIWNRQASGRRDACTWSSLLLDEDDDSHRTCTETALGLSVGHADALHAPWVVLQRGNSGWLQYRNVHRETARAEILPAGAAGGRTRYGLMFADAVGYSSLNAKDTRRYWSTLLPETAAAVLRRHADAVLFRKTWGDAIHGVFRTATAAALAALEMTAATARLVEELEFGRRLAFRVAVHFGAADAGQDPVEGTASFFGPQLSFAARIVPVAPPGGVFVTEAFAAQLSLEGAVGMECTYVGTTSLAKGYGRVRLLTLTARRAWL
jgi:hypothetical protein